MANTIVNGVRNSPYDFFLKSYADNDQQRYRVPGVVVCAQMSNKGEEVSTKHMYVPRNVPTQGAVYITARNGNVLQLLHLRQSFPLTHSRFLGISTAE